MAFAIYTTVTALFLACFRKIVVACAFDSDFARVAGLPVRWVDSIMTAVVAVGIVLTIRLIGIMLLISILTVPVIVAEDMVSPLLSLLWLWPPLSWGG